MKLYDIDYTKLSPDDNAKWKLLQDKAVVEHEKLKISRHIPLSKYPKAVRHFDSLFPNNYLDTVELTECKEQFNELVKSFQNLINSENIQEREILNFISQKQGYFIIASILKKHFNFGHHGAYLFREFQLGNSYKVDYLLIGKSSDGWHFVFVELEAVRGRITKSEDGNLGEVFRKGLEQISDWNSWLEARYASLSETFNKYKKPNSSLPEEFTQLDTSRIHYVVVAGRRKDFKEKTYNIRRKKQKESSTLLLHYDNLVDAAENIIS